MAHKSSFFAENIENSLQKSPPPAPLFLASSSTHEFIPFYEKNIEVIITTETFQKSKSLKSFSKVMFTYLILSFISHEYFI